MENLMNCAKEFVPLSTKEIQNGIHVLKIVECPYGSMEHKRLDISTILELPTEEEILETGKLPVAYICCPECNLTFKYETIRTKEIYSELVALAIHNCLNLKATPYA